MDLDEFFDIFLTEVVFLTGFENEVEDKLFLEFEFGHEVADLAHDIVIPGIKEDFFSFELRLLKELFLIFLLFVSASYGPDLFGEHFAIVQIATG